MTHYPLARTPTLVNSISLDDLSHPQVVRAVAFSGSGDMVAIGANSRTLRLCKTAAMLRKKAR